VGNFICTKKFVTRGGVIDSYKQSFIVADLYTSPKLKGLNVMSVGKRRYRLQTLGEIESAP